MVCCIPCNTQYVQLDILAGGKKEMESEASANYPNSLHYYVI